MFAILRFLIPLLIIIIPVIYYYRKIKRMFNPNRGNAEGKRTKTADSIEMVKDEVCGKFILKNDSLEVKKGGVKYYFCSEDCRNKFLQSENNNG